MIIYKVVKSRSWPSWHVLDDWEWFLLTKYIAFKTYYTFTISDKDINFCLLVWERDTINSGIEYGVLNIVGILQWTTNKDRKTYVHKKANINLKVLIKNLSSTQCKLEENLKWRRVTLSGPYAAKSFGQDAIRVAILAASKKTTTGQEKIKTGKVKL